MNHGNGFSLIEVLVTLVLTTIGILGMVAMQGRSIQYTQDAVQRNAAVMLTSDLLEIIRANPSEIFQKSPPTDPFYSDFKGNSPFYKAAGSNFTTAPADCPSTPKTALEMRDCWIANTQTTLPGAADLFKDAFYICRSSSPGSCDGNGSMLEIQLAWSVKAGSCPDDRAPNETTCIYRTRAEL